ncbi:hypothetical protein TNCV_2844421 [Trichonephila clavipes]|nr:hypothetical protein TNCV_2844421 [Trichonephila clavipes]
MSLKTLGDNMTDNLVHVAPVHLESSPIQLELPYEKIRHEALDPLYGMMDLVDKSSVVTRKQLVVEGGVIDPGYRGEIVVILRNMSQQTVYSTWRFRGSNGECVYWTHSEINICLTD